VLTAPFRRLLVLLVAFAATAALLAPAALAVSVHVRVEGKTTTIFGPAEPTLTATSTALDALESASLAGEFYYHVQDSAFGPYVDQIGRYKAAAESGWVFKVNGALPPVGADKVALKDGDHVLWYYAVFGVAGMGPTTLDLQRAAGRCYRVVARGDNGKPSVPPGAVLHVDGRSVPARSGKACVGRHTGLVRATAPNAVRSNALR
jgi:hypothetical protein